MIHLVQNDGELGYVREGSPTIYVFKAGDPEGQRQARERAWAGESAQDVVKSPTFDIKKFYDEQQLVFGWASVAKNADGTRPIEWQGDEIEMNEMEPAIYTFVLTEGITKELHRPEAARGNLVESVVLTKEKMQAMGIPEGVTPEGWWVGFKVHDRGTFMKVKDGTFKMFSIEGKGSRTAIV